MISVEGNHSIPKWVRDLKNVKSTECKQDVMKKPGSIRFNSHFFTTSSRISPFSTKRTSTRTSFNTFKTESAQKTDLVVASTDYNFHIHVDYSNIVTGCILIQQSPERKRVVFFNSRVFDEAEKKKINPPQRTFSECFRSTNRWTLHRWLHFSNISTLRPKSDSLSLGTQKTTITLVLWISSDLNEISKF